MLYVLALIGVAWMGLRWSNSRALPGHRLGVRNGQLAACPDAPNCVSTQAERTGQQIDPVPLTVPTDRALQSLQGVIQSMRGSRIVRRENGYLHAEFRSWLLGFIDDVEFWVDEPGQVIHVRSASRVGHSDLGVNRTRTAEIRRRYLSQVPQAVGERE